MSGGIVRRWNNALMITKNGTMNAQTVNVSSAPLTKKDGVRIIKGAMIRIVGINASNNYIY
jgi:hypothetical protein